MTTQLPPLIVLQCDLTFHLTFIPGIKIQGPCFFHISVFRGWAILFACLFDLKKRFVEKDVLGGFFFEMLFFAYYSEKIKEI